MNRTVWLCCLIAVLSLALLFRAFKNQREPSSGQNITEAAPQPLSIAPQTAVLEYPKHLQYAARQRRADPNWDHTRPIEFYGIAVDEEGNPVPGVSVHFIWNDTSPSGSSEAHTTSDEHGRFSLRGVAGKFLSLRMSKPGYNVSWDQHQFGFEYGNPAEENFHTPQPDNPVVFHLHSRLEPEPLIHRWYSTHLPRDGTTVGFDLLEGKPSVNGHLRIQAWVLSQRDQRRRVDWKIRLQTIGGGLVEIQEEFPGSAPIDGYTSSFEFSFHSESNDWQGNLEKAFFFRLDVPRRYGRIIFSTGAAGTHYSVDYFFNPSGSRNLEYDPDLVAPDN